MKFSIFIFFHFLKDVGEKINIQDKHPEVVERLKKLPQNMLIWDAAPQVNCGRLKVNYIFGKVK